MNYDIPLTVIELSAFIKKDCDNYKAKRITIDELSDKIKWYSEKVPEKLYDGDNGFNQSLKNIIGIRRLRLIEVILNDNNINKNL